MAYMVCKPILVFSLSLSQAEQFQNYIFEGILDLCSKNNEALIKVTLAWLFDSYMLTESGCET